MFERKKVPYLLQENYEITNCRISKTSQQRRCSQILYCYII